MSKYVNKTDGKFNHGKWIRENSLNEKLSTSWIKDRQVKGKVDAVIKTLKNLYGSEETVDGETMEFILKAVGLKGQIKKQMENINERLSTQSYKRMDGLHNVQDMKVILRRVGIFYRELSIDLEDEGFEKDEILEFLIAKIKNAI
tara:strand:+ start:308 stop:742 length:435 start_codon:yes stop_codon:yes gene_type:complete